MAFDAINGTRRAIVIGAGVNGLVAAAALARRGAFVTVLERAAAPGGMMAGGPMEIALFARGPHPSALEELGLDAAALGPALPTVALDPGGRHIVVDGAEVRYADGGAHPGAADWRALSSRLDRFADALAPLLTGPPPRLRVDGAGKLASLLRGALRVRRLGAADMRELLRVGLSNAADLAADSLSDDLLAGLLAFDAVLGSRAGPASPGTVVPLLLRRAPLRRPAGGMTPLAGRIADAAAARGARILYGAAVAKILVEGNRVCGVALSNGETLDADAVLSSLGAAPTLALAGAEHFDIEACRRVRAIRSAGATARVDLLLDARPDLPNLPARLVLAPSARWVERAFDPVKYGRIPAAPAMEGWLDETPDGPRLSLTLHAVPPTGDAAEIAAAAVAALETVLPGIAATVRESRTLTPVDIERLTGAPGGHWHHGEIALDQFLTLRPANGMAGGMGPPGLHLCGAGAHPGGDISGLPGRNGALAALAEARP